MDNKEICNVLRLLAPSITSSTSSKREVCSVVFINNEDLIGNGPMGVTYNADIVITKSGKVIKNRNGQVDILD